MTENSRRVFDYLKENYGQNITAQKIKDDLGVSIPAVTGSVNGLVKKGFAVRNEVTVTGEDEKETTIKYISLTDEGYNFNPDAE